MSHLVPARPSRVSVAALALAAVLCLGGTVHAKLFVFKDGFVIEGEPQRLQESKWMGAKEGFLLIPKGFYFIDDGPRIIVFKPTDLRDIVATGDPDRVKLLGWPWMQAAAKPMLPVLEVLETTPWDRNWKRKITIRSEGANGPLTLTLPQQIYMISSYYLGVPSAGRYSWSSFYLTRELGPDEVGSLLDCAPELKEKPGMADDKRATLRYKRINFLLQAGWYGPAEKELDRLVADIPDQKSKAEETRKTITTRRLNDKLDKLKRLQASGQNETVRKLAAALQHKDAPLQVKTTIQDIESQAKATANRIAETRRLLRMAQQEASGPHSATLSEAVQSVRASLQAENIDKLETFLSQARQYERQQKAGKKTTASGDQLLALAVSGWLLGSAAADTKPDNAAALWRGRQLVLDYTSANNPAKRKRLLQDYEARSRENAAIDDIFRMIPSLPPPEADDKLTAEVQERTVAGARNINYQLQLPPEYRHTRSYPLLIVLHNSGEKARDMLDRWRETAAEHGYIVAAPEWGSGFQNGYSYSEAEHETVLATLRDLRRRFQVDSDRVFLFGLGEGGKMAFDVGLAHPGDFAGVVPMAAAPEMFSSTYWPNGQYLPLYVVHGRQDDPGGYERLKDMFTLWTQKGQTAFPSIWVDYKGRGCEWFGGEVNNIFEWMRAKRRAFPLEQVGRHSGTNLDIDFRTLRPGDNRFYWLGIDKLDSGRTKTANNYHLGRLTPALVAARIDAQSNTIRVNAEGVGEVTVWLGRDSKGANMITFNKPVTVSLNARPLPQLGKKPVTPSLETLLEDLYERGDRQQMYLAKIVLP